MQRRTCTFWVAALLLFLFSLARAAPTIGAPVVGDGAHNANSGIAPLTRATQEQTAPEVAAASVAITPKIVASFMVPGDRAQTITWASDNLWLADVNKNVYRLNANGEVLSSFPITFTPYGLAWDGNNLWAGNETPYDSWRLFQLDGAGHVIKALSGVWEGSPIGSIAWADNHFYVANHYSPGLIHKLDQAGQHLLSWQPDFIGLPWGMAYDGTGMWIGENCFGDTRNDLYRYTLLGERLNSIDLNAIGIKCSFVTQETRGLAWDGKFLWYTGDDIFTVYKLDIGVPDILVSPTQLNFGAVPMYSTGVQTITVQNTGNIAKPISSISIAGDFAHSTTCPTDAGLLAAGASCTIRATFTPVTLDARTGAITITHYTDVRPHTVSLAGAGSAPAVTLTPGSLTFSNQPVGVASAAKPVTLQNPGSAGLPINNITTSGDFAQTHNCPAILAAGSSCAINVTFIPQTTGTRNGTLTVTISPGLTPRTVSLIGTGIADPPTYTLQVNKNGNGEVAVNPGGPYSSGQSVTLTASPDPGWTFTGWGNDLTGTNNPATISITKNTVIVANFTATCYALTLSHSGAGGDPVATPANSLGCANGQYAVGATINLSASPSLGWQVSGWQGTLQNTTTAPSNTLTMPANPHTVSVAYTETTTPPPGTWTLLIYAVGDNDLSRFMDVEIPGRMLARLRQAGAQPNVSVGILYDGRGANDTVRYILGENGGWNPFQQPEARMDDPDTLRDFIKWGFDTFTTDYYYLAIVDHASGVLGIGVDRTSDSSGFAYLTPSEVREAIVLGTGTGAHKLDIVHFDGCSFGLFENTSIVAGVADYVIASPNTGWGVFAYDEYRRRAGQAPNDPRTFAQAVAEIYKTKVSAEGLPYTISVFDMAYYEPVRQAIGQLGSDLNSYVKANPEQSKDELRAIRGRAQKYDSDDYELNDQDRYVDVRSLASALKAQNMVTGASDAVLNATQPFILYNQNASGAFTIITKTYTMTLAGAQGLAIYYPYSQATSAGAYQRYIKNELFANLTTNWGWTAFLDGGLPLLGPGEPELPEFEALIAFPAKDPGDPLPEPKLFLPIVMQ